MEAGLLLLKTQYIDWPQILMAPLAVFLYSFLVAKNKLQLANHDFQASIIQLSKSIRHDLASSMHFLAARVISSPNGYQLHSRQGWPKGLCLAYRTSVWLANSSPSVQELHSYTPGNWPWSRNLQNLKISASN